MDADVAVSTNLTMDTDLDIITDDELITDDDISTGIDNIANNNENSTGIDNIANNNENSTGIDEDSEDYDSIPDNIDCIEHKECNDIIFNYYNQPCTLVYNIDTTILNEQHVLTPQHVEQVMFH